MKRRIRLTEGMLHRMIRNVLNETALNYAEDYPSASAFREDYQGCYDEEPSEEDIIGSLNQEYPQWLKDRDNELSWSQIDAIESPSEFAPSRLNRVYNRNAKQFGGETNELNGWVDGYDDLDDVEYANKINRSLDESIHRAIRRVLSEGRNDELFQWFGYLIANNAQGLRSLGDIDSAKEAIAEKINQSSLTPTQKRNYLNGKYDFKGIMGAKDLNMLSKIIAQIWLASGGFSVQDTGRRKRF